MKIHSFHHVPYERLGCIENWVIENNYSLTSINLYDNFEFPSLDSFDLLIVMGGPMGVYEEEKYPWLKKEKEFIRKAIDSNKKVLGICLGSQLIANALGAKVYPNKFKEIGWLDVQLAENAKDNFLFSSLPDKFKVCQWHGDTFYLPKGAEHFAESEACKNQAFIYKDKVIGLQFHLEFTTESLNGLIYNCKDELVKDKYVQTEEEILKNINLLKTTNSLMIKLLNKLVSNK